MSENNEIKKQERSTITLIQQIKDGLLDADTINKELRQQIVEVMLSEGYNVPSMAQLMKVSDKTIRRDIDEIRERNALSPDINLAKKLIGEMLTYVRIHRDHLMRLARSSNTSVSEKAQAEYYAAQIGMTLITKLQSLGYLPSQPQAVVGNIHHTFSNSDLNVLSDELGQELDEVMDVMDSTTNAPESFKQAIKELDLFLNKEKQLGKESPGEEEGNV